MGLIKQKSTPTGKTATVENRTIDALVEDFKELNDNIPAAYVPPLIYAGKITQDVTGTNPVFSGAKNTIGNIVWERISDGVFKGTVPVGIVITPENSYANVMLQIREYGLEAHADLAINTDGYIYLQIYYNALNFIDEFTAYIKIEIYQ